MEKIKRILVIEDDEDMCCEVGEILKEEGYSVTTAFDGLEGKNLAESGDYDIILLDLKMPKLRGIEVMKSVREKRADMKILVMTGTVLENESEEKEAISNLADGCINKPFDVAKMLVKIKNLSG
jgi:DNA-binding response OmpR family regulator